MRINLSKGKLRNVLLLLIAVWGWFVLLSFLRVNPLPFDFLRRLSLAHYPEISALNALLALGGHLLRFFVLALIVVVAESLGRRLFLFFRMKDAAELTVFISSLVLGLSLLAYFIFVLAAASLLAREFSLSLLLMVAVYALLSDGRAALVRWRGLGRLLPRNVSPYGVILAAVLLLVLLGHLVPQNHFDVSVYHFALPNAYLNAGEFIQPETNLFSGYPGNMSMLYLLSFIAGGEGLAVLTHFFVMLLALGALYMLAERCGARGTLAVLLFLSVPMVAIGCTACLADPLVFLYEFLAAYYLIVFLGGKDQRLASAPLWLTALFSGLAMGTIYRSLAPALLVLAAVALKLLVSRRQRWSGTAGRLAKAGGLMSIPVLPWLAKNLWLTTNPFYPFFAGKLGGKGLNPELIAAQMDVYFGEQKAGLIDLFKAPWDLTMSPGGGDINFIGPLLLALLPLVVVGRFSREIKWLGVFALSQYLILGMLTPTPRHYLVFLAYFCVLIACLLGRNQHWPRALALYYRTFASGLILLGALFFARVEYLSRDPLGAALGWEGKEAYLERVMINSYYSGARFINENAKPGEAVLLFGETRSNHFQCRTLYGSAYDPQPLFSYARQAGDDGELYGKLKEKGVRFILENRSEINRLGIRARWEKLSPEKQRLLNDFRQKYLQVAWWKKAGRVDVVVYELHSEL